MENLIKNIEEIPKDKSVVAFDLDGTLAESKMKIDEEMGELLSQLLAKGKVAIIGGAKLEQMRSQLPESISNNTNLLLLPLDGGSFYINKDGMWQEVYIHELSPFQRRSIGEAFEKAFTEIGYTQPEKTYGEIIENRGGQITWSPLGQEAPLEEKEKWARENTDIRSKLEAKVAEYLPDMKVAIAGMTSIDVTQKGIDKKFGIEQIIKYLGVTKEDILFLGDAIEPNKNDYPALESGVVCYKVKSVEDTKEAIKFIIN